eukprot:jgi/Botrbrau1/10353/Bobra.0321s0028.1
MPTTSPRNTRLCILIEALAANAQMWTRYGPTWWSPSCGAMDARKAEQPCEIAVVLYRCRSPSASFLWRGAAGMSDFTQVRQLMDHCQCPVGGQAAGMSPLPGHWGEAMSCSNVRAVLGPADLRQAPLADFFGVSTIDAAFPGLIQMTLGRGEEAWPVERRYFAVSRRTGFLFRYSRRRRDQVIMRRCFLIFSMVLGLPQVKSTTELFQQVQKYHLQCSAAVSLLRSPQWDLPKTLFQPYMAPQPGSRCSSAANILLPQGPIGSQSWWAPGHPGGYGVGPTPPAPSPMGNDVWDSMPPNFSC